MSLWIRLCSHTYIHTYMQPLATLKGAAQLHPSLLHFGAEP